MRGCHTISARLDDRDLYIGLCGGHCKVFLVSSETDAAVLMKSVRSNCIVLAQPGSLKVQVIVELIKLVVVME
jgi:hypothetical protein